MSFKFTLANKLIFSYKLLSLHFLLVNSFEYGMIAYFEGKCPDGWEEYSKSAGRVIVSRGETFDSRGEKIFFKENEIGGEFNHTMTVYELVNHSHFLGTSDLIDISIEEEEYIGSNRFKGKYIMQFDDFTYQTGLGQPFNIMSPYLVLYSCKYVNQEKIQEQLQKIEKNIEQIQQVQDQKQNQETLIVQQNEIQDSKVKKQLEDLNRDDYKFDKNSFIVIVSCCGGFIIILIFILSASSNKKIKNLEKILFTQKQVLQQIFSQQQNQEQNQLILDNNQQSHEVQIKIEDIQV